MRKKFSIIITAYNSSWVIDNALQSIVEQNINNDIEVIIVDDCSNDNYEQNIKKFEKDLNIIFTRTAYNCCPGNTRQRGVDKATGEWLVFIDADDTFIPNTFPKIKKIIEENPFILEVASPSKIYSEKEKKFLGEKSATSSWTHGKFFNRDLLWDKYKLHYKKDMKSHEDVYIVNKIQALIHAKDKAVVIFNEPTYIWHQWDSNYSCTMVKYNGTEVDFLEYYFEDYLYSCGQQVIDLYKKGMTDYDYALANSLNVINMCYFYCQGFMFYHPKDFLRENIYYAQRFWKEVKRVFDIDAEIIYFSNIYNKCAAWVETKELAMSMMDNIIEPYSFREWIKLMEE